MKIPDSDRRRGAALLLVLGALILVSVIVIGFLVTVRQDRSAAASYKSGASARQYADTAINVAIAQIAEATSDPNVAWISQPGMIRTFDAGGPVAAYKLYSSPALKVTGAFDPASSLDAEVPPTWFSDTTGNTWVDLNRPVTTTISGSTRLVYPIADPFATSEVEGFSFDAAGRVPAPGSAGYNALPMPVTWIYVRKNGALIGAAAAQAASDVVARFAFWTDDETTKINVNTASDGVYYDYPTYNSAQDYWLGVTQPVAQEYQRYPGHPATTSLAAVFKKLRDIPDDDLMSGYSDFGSGIVYGPATRASTAATITPRISTINLSNPSATDGGSNGGRKMAWLTKNPVLPDADRLYASLDELFFTRNNATKDWTDSSGARYTTSLADAPDRLQFFLTTDSRAPELTLFNRPRITLWPFNTDLLDESAANPKLTPEDRLIRFASEIGSNHRKLYFQRKDAWDPAYDYEQIPENKQLYAYLQWSTRQSFPSANPSRAGAGHTLESKYATDGRDQILTEMFDYLRSTVNNFNYSYRPIGGPFYSFPPAHTPTSDGIYMVGFNDICPLMFTPDGGSSTTKGLASPVISEVMFQFYNAGEYFAGQSFSESPGSYGLVTGTATGGSTPSYVIRRVQMVCLLNIMQVSNNLNSTNQRFQVRITGTPFGFAVSGTSNIDMRFAGEDDTAWRKIISVPGLGGTDPEGIGFPQPSGGNKLNTTLVCAQGGDDGSNALKGGDAGIAWAMMFPSSSNLADPRNSTQAKTLTNDPNGAIRYFDGGSIASTQQLRSQVYPFVSRVIEFRIPNSTITAGEVSPYNVGSPTVNLLSATEAFKIELFAGLASSGGYNDDFTPANPNFTLQPLAASKLLSTTTLNVQPCEIPLPLLGNTNPVVDGAWKSPANNNTEVDYPRNTVQFPANPSQPPSGKDMQYYPRRFWPWYKNYIAQVPRGTSGSNGQGGERDVIRSYYLRGDAGCYGDFRLAAMRTTIPVAWWTPAPNYFDKTKYVATAQNFIDIPNSWMVTGVSARLLQGKSFASPVRVASPTMNGAFRKSGSGSPTTIGDFTTGYGYFPGGAGVVGPDVGAVGLDLGSNNLYDPGDNAGPYYSSSLSRSSETDALTSSGWYHTNLFGISYSPWKQMPSAVMFGTLPSRILDDGPWETLLFCPNPPGGQDSHRGWASLPRDHYWLDLFTMPVVEPYAITENFATNGKINLNYQIAPFTYVQRKTGLYGLLRNLQISAVPDTDSDSFRPGDGAKYSTDINFKNRKYRFPVDVAETLKGFDARFAAGKNDPFVSATEICEMFLVPNGATYGPDGSAIKSYWSTKNLTGDDKRESPYNALYPRVTTRSNTYKVHFIAQTLKGKPGAWNVTGQYRGSQIIERYLDGFSGASAAREYGNGTAPATQFPALAGADDTGKPYYRFRKLSHQQFSP